MGQETAKKNIKLVALDMDGTLLSPDQTVSERNQKAVAKALEQGIDVVLCTGRSLPTCRDFAKALNLSSYLITVNGSEIWTSTEELVERQLLDAEVIKRLVELRNTHKTRAWMVSTNQVWREDTPEEIDSHEWLKFGFDTDSNDVKWKIVNELSEDARLELSNSSPTNIEVNAVGINKAKALEKICKLNDITMEEVMTIGDSLNDIKMIKEAGLGVAMGNAQEEVKKTADWITATNEEDGVAKAIEHWVI